MYNSQICIYVLSLVKMVYGFAKKAELGDLVSDIELEQCIRRNFSGLDDLDPMKIFSRQFLRLKGCIKVINVASLGSVFNDTRKVKILSLPETIKEKSTFRAKALRRELVLLTPDEGPSLETSNKKYMFVCALLVISL